MLKKANGRFRNAARLRKILSVLGSHGFHALAVRAKLGKFVSERWLTRDLEERSEPERLRMSFEQLGPTFVKLGQLLATRPDLIPIEYSEEFKKLHDQVPGLPFGEIEKLLTDHFGASLEQVFAFIDPVPLAAASIAQVHLAELRTGEKVVIKVQRPGIERVIQEDLQILKALAELADKYLPEIRPYNPTGIVGEFSRTMELETNFVVEANNVRRFALNFAEDAYVKIPKVYSEFTGRRVLVLEALQGLPLSQRGALDQDGVDREELLKNGLRAYMKMVYTDGLFHGDLHAGNVLLLPENKIGLIDFGIVGRLNRKTQAAIASMFLALADEDYDRLAYLYVDLAPFSDRVDVDQFARDIRDLIAPYFGLTMRNVNLGRMLLESTAVAAQHGLRLPTELVLFFKSVMSLEGMGRAISKDFDFLSYSIDFARDLLVVGFEPKQMVSDASVFARDMNSMIATVPRQMKQVLRRLNDPDLAFQLRSKDLDRLRKSIDRGVWVLFWGLVLSSVILGFLLQTRR